MYSIQSQHFQTQPRASLTQRLWDYFVQVRTVTVQDSDSEASEPALLAGPPGPGTPTPSRSRASASESWTESGGESSVVGPGPPLTSPRLMATSDSRSESDSLRGVRLGVRRVASWTSESLDLAFGCKREAKERVSHIPHCQWQ